MRIVHVVPFFQIDVQRWTEKLVFNQKKHYDYDIEVITTNLNTTGKPVYRTGRDQIGDITITRLSGIKVRNQFVSLSKDILRRLECNILHLHNFGTIFCELSLISNKELPTVLKPDIGKLYPAYNPLKKVEWDYVDIVTAFNDREIKILRKIGFTEKAIKMIPWGVEESFIEFGKKIKPNVERVLIVARIMPIKNIELAIKAIAQTRETTLNIVGPIIDVEYFEFLRKLCEKLGVSKRVRFRGKIPYNKLPAEYARNYLTLATSIHESGGPASVIESLATGRPAICVPLELVKNLRKYYAEDSMGGIVVVDYTPQKIAEEIEHLQEDKAYWKKLSRGGHKAARKFSWKKVVEVMDKIYMSIAN